MANDPKLARPDLRIFINAWQKGDDDSNDEPVEYTLTQNLNDAKIRTGKDNYVWAENGEDFVILFKICDNTNLNLKFMDDPIYMNPAGDTNCPPPDIGNPQLPDGYAVILKRKKRFKLRNPQPNWQNKQYKYRLRIIDKDGKRRDFDPIIQNGNGPPVRYWPAYLVPLLGTLAFAGIAFAAAYAAGLLP